MSGYRKELISCSRVCWRCVGYPDHASFAVRAVPNPATARDLKLPLLKIVALDHAASELTLEPVLPMWCARIFWAIGKSLPGLPEVPGCDLDKLFPTLGRFFGCKAQFPSARGGWRCYPIIPLRHQLPPATSAQGQDRGRSLPPERALGRVPGQHESPQSAAIHESFSRTASIHQARCKPRGST